jgi:hypothetical protein
MLLPAVLIIAFLMSFGFLVLKIAARNKNQPTALMGGAVHTMATVDNVKMNSAPNDIDFSRFQRPSAQPALDNPYNFAQFDKNSSEGPLSLDQFKTSEDVILAYFGILREAANMADYSGGCGTIGWAVLPYTYAYELLADSRKESMTLQQFEDSFQGIGHLTLLKIYPAYTPPGTPENIRYHMIEVEIITGAAMNDPAGFRSGSHFAYFYGIVTTELDNDTGWKIKAIDYFPEDFLCHPMHGWEYDAQYFVPFIYRDSYHLIDKIDKTEQNGNIISVYASGSGKQYRFDFVRITNGEDVLLHEMINQNGQWIETNLIKNQRYKLSIQNPNLQKG